MIPLAQYAPDQPILGSQFASIALNVVPKTAASYGPLPGLSVFSGALSARCQGAYADKDVTGSVHNFAGDASKLYKLSGTTWSEVSKVGGYTVSSEDMWEFVSWNQSLIIACQVGNPIQSYTLGSSSVFADLAAAAPQAKHIAVIGKFVMVGNLSGASNSVQWCAFNNPTDWPVPGTADAEGKQSNSFALPSGGAVQRIIGAVGGADGLIFMERAVYQVRYKGDGSDTFDFIEIERGRGVDAPYSIVNVGPFALYWGVDGIYKTDGAIAVPIGAGRVDKTHVQDDADDNFINRVVGSADPASKLIHWIYPSAGGVGGGTCDTDLIYEHQLDRFTVAEFNSEFIYQSLSAGLTLEDLDSISSSLDALPLSLDHRTYAGGRGTIGVFDTSHKLSSLSGDNLAATVETGEFDPANSRVVVQGIRPLVDGGTITAAVGYRDTPQASVTFTTASSAGSDGVCPQRIAARYAKARVSIAAAGSWTHAQGIEAIYRPEGRR